MGIRIKKYLLLSIICITLSISIALKVSATEGGGIIITPPREKEDGTMLVKVGESNDLKFGICGSASNPVKLNAVLSGEGVSDPAPASGLQENYSIARSPEEKCKNNMNIYGPKVTLTYKPSSIGTKSLTIKYFQKGINDPFRKHEFILNAVNEWPTDATKPKDTWAPPDLTKFGNMLAINDIFGDKLKLNSEIEGGTPQGLIAKILTILLEISAVLALLAFVWSGFQFVTSSGEPGQVEKAKKAMVGAFIGLLIIIFAYSIIRAVDIFSSPPKEDSFKEIWIEN